MKRSPKFKKGDVVRMPYSPASTKRSSKGRIASIIVGNDKEIKLYDLAEITDYDAENNTYSLRIKGLTDKDVLEIKDLAAEFIEEDCVQDTIQTMKNTKQND